MRWQCKVITVNFVNNNRDHTATVMFDFYPKGIVEIQAILDSGSSVSFLSKELLIQHAPHYLGQLLPCPTKFKGVEGSGLQVAGILYITCRVNERVLAHHFVVADLVESVLLGLDFMNQYRVNYHQRKWW